jgi:hypothetical protein
MGGLRLLLLQVFFDELGFAKQVGDELFVGVNETREGFEIGGEFFGEAKVFLIAPGLSEVAEVSGDDTGFFVEFFVEAAKQLGESPQFAGIDNSLSHLWEFPGCTIECMPRRLAVCRRSPLHVI